MTDQRLTAASSLSFINNNMLPKVNGAYMPSILFGGGQLSTNFKNTWPSAIPSSSTDASKFFWELFNQGSAGSALALKAAANQSLSSIVLAGGSSYTANTTISFTGNVLNASITDINLYSWIDQTNANGTLYAGIMQKVYLIHDLFLPTNWNNFSNGNSVNLQGFNKTGTLLQNIKLVATAPTDTGAYNVTTSAAPSSGTAVPYVLISDLSTVGGESVPLITMTTVSNMNTFIIRRLFFLWIRMANYRIASMANNTATDIQKACYVLLSKANDDVVVQSDGTGVTAEIYAGLSDKQRVMRGATGVLNQLNSDMASYQTTAQQAKNSISTEQAFDKKVRIVEYVALGILVVVFMACGFLTGSFDVDPGMKLKMSMGVFLAAAFSVAMIVVIYQSKIMTTENFDTSIPLASTAYGATGIATDTGFQNNVATYLANTISLSSALDSYDLATNMNQAMINDTVKYINVNQDLQIAGRRLNDIAKTVDVEKAQHNSSVYLLLTLTMVLAVMLPIYVWAANAPMIRVGVMVISGAVAFMALLVHAYESTSIVRTDGHKKYWGQPAAFAKN